MKLLQRLKKKASSLKKEITALYYASRDPRMPLLPKVLALFTLAYALSPVDLIPDFIPVLGYLDDILLLPLLLALSIRLVPQDLMAESRRRAEEEPLTLGKSRVAAAVIILIWLAVLTWLIRSAIDIFSTA